MFLYKRCIRITLVFIEKHLSKLRELNVNMLALLERYKLKLDFYKLKIQEYIVKLQKYIVKNKQKKIINTLYIFNYKGSIFFTFYY